MDSTPPTNRSRCDRVNSPATDTELKPQETPVAGGLGATLRSFTHTASVLAVLALSAIGGRYGHRWLTTTERFGARDVSVTGASRTPPSEILAAARISATRNVLSIDPDRAARAIEALPWVAHATVSR